VAAIPAPAPDHSVAVGHVEEPTTTGLNHRKLLMWAFLGSDCLLFGSLISTYMIYRGKSVTPPINPRDVFNIPYTSVSAFVLLMSSLAMVLALAAIQRGDVHRMRVWLVATACLGMVFLGGQFYEFTNFATVKGLTIGGNIFGTTFFVLTGFHGTHVTVGVIWLLSVVAASYQGRIKQQNSLDVEIAGLYWHFVDIVWIAIFTLVYLVPAI
jgi:heme/copper-type cytochrome/quinol oxidase subunit 3